MNYVLIPGLKENVDFVIVDENIIEFFFNKYSGHKIKRNARLKSNGEK